MRIRVVILMPYVFEWTGRRLRGSFEQASVQLPGPDDPDGIEQPIRRPVTWSWSGSGADASGFAGPSARGVS